MILLKDDGIGWGGTLRVGKLNEDGTGSSSVSNGYSTDLLSFEVYNSRVYPDHNFEVQTSVGWEKFEVLTTPETDSSITFSISLSKLF
jgi:hypothetical protein